MSERLNRRDFMGMTIVASLAACGGAEPPETSAALALLAFRLPA